MSKKLASGLLLSALFSRLLFSQTVEENLLILGSLIDNSLSSIESVMSDNELLRQTLGSLESSLRTQSVLLDEQGRLLSEQEENFNQRQQIYEAQRQYLETLQFKFKVCKVSLIVAVPTCIGLGALLGWYLSGSLNK